MGTKSGIAGEEEKVKLSPRERNKPLEHHDIAVTLKYRDYKPVVSEIKVVSKPGKKKYVSFQVCKVVPCPWPACVSNRTSVV